MIRKALIATSLACFRHPWPVLLGAAVLFSLALQLTVTRLQLRMDWVYLFSPDDPIVRRVAEHRREFPLPGDVVVLVDRGTPEERRAYLQQLATRLQAEPKLFQHLYYRLDLRQLRAKALYYLSTEQLQALVESLNRLEPMLGGPTTGNPEELLARELANSHSPMWSEPALRLANRLLQELEESIAARGQGRTERLWRVLLPPEMLDRLAISPEQLLNPQGSLDATLDHGRIHYLTTKTPRDAGPAVVRLREILQEVNRGAPDLRIRLSGLPVLLHDERQTCTDDSARSSLISLLGVVFLFVVGFGELRRPLMAVLALVIGLGWTMGFATLAIGHLNFITVTYISILLGMGVDFGIHLAFRYAEEKRRSETSEIALALTMNGTGVDVLVGAVASAVAFGMLSLVGFRGVGDLGVIAGAGVMLCFLSTVTVLPACLKLGERWALPTIGELKADSLLLRLQDGILRLSPLVVLAGLWITAACLWEAPKVGFDDNLLNMQAPNLESIRTELDMVRERRSVLSATAIAPSLEEARALEGRFKQLQGVASVGSLTALIPADLERKRPLVTTVVSRLEGLELPEVGATRELRGLAKSLALLRERLPELQGELATSAQRREMQKLEGHLNQLSTELRELGPGVIEDGVTTFRDNLLRDLRLSVDFLKVLSASPPTLQDIPEALRVRYLGVSGKVQLSVQPVENIWEREALERFVASVERVDHEMVGHPIVMDHITGVIRETHQRAAAATLAGVVLVMLLHLRSPGTVLLSLLPTGLSVIWMLGAMAWWGIRFNSANFVALPMVVGIGAVYGIHVINRIREDRHERILLSSTGRALVLSGLTTMVGFGSLLVAHHRGIESLGFIISVGVAANLVASLLLMPALSYLRRAGRPRA